MSLYWKKYGADTELEFTPMHKVARVQLPDLQTVDARVDYSVPVFTAVSALCKELTIRHPEELSFKRYIPVDRLKKGLGFEEDSIRAGAVVPLPGTLRRQTPISASAHNLSGAQQQGVSPHGRQVSPGFDNVNVQRGKSPGSPNFIAPSLSWGDSLVTLSEADAKKHLQPLVHSPPVNVKNAEKSGGIFRPKNFEEKAALNRGWLDSSRSLMEQGIYEGELILLRFKFMQFFDLSPKYDGVRLNQLYEQAKWSVLMEEIDCTDEESMMFAALQLQAHVQRGQDEQLQPDEHTDVDQLLDELESQLDVAAAERARDITQVPELAEYLRYFKPKRLTLKGWKRGFFVFRDLYLSYYNTAQEAQGPPVGRVCLKGCEVTPDVNLAQNKFVIKVLVPSAEGMSELHVKCESEHQYVRWMAGFKLAARGRSMADAAYNGEVESLKRLLQMQQPAPVRQTHSGSKSMPSNFEPDEYVPVRVAKKRNRQQMQNRIGEAWANVKSLSGADAKMQYVRAWQALPEHGIHYFIVRFRGGKKNELLGVAYNRMMRMNVDTGDAVKTWRYGTMKKWHVNWEIKHVLAQLEEENVEFKPISADCKVCHEFIGGYIFLSMRSKDQNQSLDENLFHKLTGGMVAIKTGPGPTIAQLHGGIA